MQPIDPREIWQREALDRYERTDKASFLLEATPGAGKTRWACRVIKRLMDEGTITFAIVVVPREPLKDQWAKEASRWGLTLWPHLENEMPPRMPKDCQGAVITYAALASGVGVEMARWLMKRAAVVVLDEVHHCGEPEYSRWGEAVEQAFATGVVRRLLLSGTPFRSDRRRISFVDYDDQGTAIADYPYDYSRAVRDGVVRAVEFRAYDGEARWLDVTGQTVAALLSATTMEDERIAARAALLPDGEWIPGVLAAADGELSRQRLDMPDAGGLVIAARIDYAWRYAALLKQLTGESVEVIVSKEEEEGSPVKVDRLREAIRRFEAGTSRWMVAVQMISEGVDIPRLGVLVYATDKWTEMYFRQGVGRVIRRRTGDELSAMVFIPSVASLLNLAASIDDQADAALRDASEDSGLGRELGGQRIFELRQPIDSGEAQLHSAIYRSETYTREELATAARLRNQFPDQLSRTAETTIAFLQRQFSAPVRGHVVLDLERPPTIPLYRQLEAARKRVIKAVNQHAIHRQVPYSHIHSELNRICGDTLPTAGMETIQRRLSLVAEWEQQNR